MKWLILFLTILLLAACNSLPQTIPADLTPMEIIQRGQEASDSNRFAAALVYYQTLIERFPSNIDFVCAAEYEIAFIHYKQKNFDEARSRFNALLARYNTPDSELLPPQFKILCGIVLARIVEAEKPKGFFN